jgi:putative membrane protein
VRGLTVLFWIAGLAVIAVLVYLVDFAEMAHSVAVIGWSFVPVLSVRVIVLFVDSQSWRSLLPKMTQSTWRMAAYQRWVGESVSTMLPFAAIGGELARIRVILLSGIAGPLAVASIIMDGVVALVSQFLFLCLGITLFARTAAHVESLNQSILIGGVALLIAVVSVWMLVRGGVLGRLATMLKENLAGDRVAWLARAMGSVDGWIAAITDRPIVVARSIAWRLLGWLLGASEIWLILYLLGQPISISDALILDAVTAAVRTAFFFVPGGLAVQEGAMILVGATLGVDADAMLVAAVIKRSREIIFSIPGLLAWEIFESKSLRQSVTAARSVTDV